MKTTKANPKDFGHGGFKSFLKRAIQLGLEVKTFTDAPSVVRLKYGTRIKYVSKNVIPAIKRLGSLTKNKETSKVIMQDSGISVPRGVLVESYREALKLIRRARLRYPLIVKPLDGSRATGVTLNIGNEQELVQGVKFVLSKMAEFSDQLKSRKFMVEEMFVGEEYRVLVFDGKVVSCVHKIPASVIGDGRSTVAQLIRQFDRTRFKGFTIRLDRIARENIAHAGFTLKSVLPAGFRLKLRSNMNMSDGGRSIDVTAALHPHFKKICERSVTDLGLSYGGVDLIATDASSAQSPYVILEVNPNPYYNMHEKPLVEGPGIDFSEILLRSLFPELKAKKKK